MKEYVDYLKAVIEMVTLYDKYNYFLIVLFIIFFIGLLIGSLIMLKSTIVDRKIKSKLSFFVSSLFLLFMSVITIIIFVTFLENLKISKENAMIVKLQLIKESIEIEKKELITNQYEQCMSLVKDYNIPKDISIKEVKELINLSSNSCHKQSIETAKGKK